MLKTIWKLIRTAVVVIGVFMQVWANLAVGIIGNENNPANLMFLAIPVIGVLGAVFARFKVTGMVRTLYVMAIVQVMIAIAAWAWVGANIALITFFFVLVWLTSAAMFRKAAGND